MILQNGSAGTSLETQLEIEPGTTASTTSIQFEADTTFLVVAGLVLVGVAALGVRAWLRSGRRTSILALEVLRLVIVALVLAALTGPEQVRSEVPEEDPLVAVLWDDSLSMNTRDAIRSEGDGGSVARSRADVVREQLDALMAQSDAEQTSGEESALTDRFELVTSPLSAAPGGEVGDDAGDESGTAVTSARGTDLATPLTRALKDRSLRAVVLLSDGDWNEGGSPYDAAVRYRLADVPIFTVCIGSPNRLPDIALEPVDPPAFAIVGRPIEIPISITSSMPRDVTTTITLSDANGVLESRPLLIPARRTIGETIEFRPLVAGRAALTVEVAPHAGELDVRNNTRSFEIDAREESLRVLLVESVPRWEYRYLRNALVRDPGVEVDCYLTHPTLDATGGGPHYIDTFPAKETLSAYDVVFVGDVGIGPMGLSVEQCALIAGLVRDQASGLILMPGLGGGHVELMETALGDLFPVDLDPAEIRGFGSAAPSRLVLTEAGRASALTRLLPDTAENARLWQDLPGFQWHAATVRARAGAQVLAVHADSETAYGRRPLLVTRTARTGKVLFMGTDGAWRWREGYEDLYHYRFWGQVIRWMAYQRNMNVGETMRLFFAPDRPLARTTIALNANVMDASGAPVEGGTVRARIQAPSGRVERITFEPATGDGSLGDREAWGLYTASFLPTEGGRHSVELTCEETGAILNAEIPVIGRPREQLGMPARFDVMAEISRIARGEVIESFTPEDVAQRLAALPPPPPFVTRMRLWSHPLFGLLVAVLMAALWIGRKLVGRV